MAELSANILTPENPEEFVTWAYRQQGGLQLMADRMKYYESRAKSKCVWIENFDPDYWETSCGQSFTLIDGTLEDNHIRFCAFCGCEIAAQPAGAADRDPGAQPSIVDGDRNHEVRGG